jgi:hypothetical protein
MARNPVAVFFLPDSGRDGVVSLPEWWKFVAARALLAISIGLCAWTVAADILGPLFGGLFGFMGVFVGYLFGAAVGAIAPFMEAFGVYFMSRARTGAGKFGFGVLMVFCMVITVGSMLLLASHMIAADRERLAAAETADAAALEQAGAMRDTSGAEQRMADARADLARALTARDEAEALRAELAALPAGAYSARVAEIQTIIGARPDGIKFDQTTEAMRVFADRAQTEYDAALARRDRAQDALDAVTASVSSGEVAAVALSATNAAKTFSIVKSFRQLAYMSFKARGDERQFDEAAIDERAKNFADIFSFILVLAINVLNFGLNNTGHAKREEPRGARPATAGALPAPDPDGPEPGLQGEKIARRMNAEDYIADDAPMQFGEAPSAAKARLARAKAALQKGSTGVADVGRLSLEDELANREAAALERIANAQRVREIERLEREALEAESLEIPGYRRPAGYSEETRIVRRTNGNGSDDDLESIIARVEALKQARPGPRPEPEVSGRGLSDDDFEAMISRYQAADKALRDINITIQNGGPPAAEARKIQSDLQGRVHVLKEQILVEDRNRRRAPRRHTPMPLSDKLDGKG